MLIATPQQIQELEKSGFEVIDNVVVQREFKSLDAKDKICNEGMKSRF